MRAAREEMFTMRPQRRRSIPRTTAFVDRNAPPSDVSITSSQCASGMSAKRPFRSVAALFTRTSTPPRSASRRSATATISSREVASAFAASALPPLSAILRTVSAAPVSSER